VRSFFYERFRQWRRHGPYQTPFLTLADLTFKTEGVADRVVQLLQNRDLADIMGKEGKETVLRNFLVTRLIIDRLNLYESLLQRRN